MQFNWRSELPLILIPVLMLVASGFAWPFSPDTIPVHWNIHGQVDRFGGRFEGLVVIPLIALATSVVLMVIPKIDPANLNYESFEPAYWLIRAAILSVPAILHTCVLLITFGYPVNIGFVVSISVGALCFVLGNVMGKIRPNWFVGVRTPWTLTSRLSWNKTHRLAGWLTIAMGLAYAAFGVWQTSFMLVFVIAVTLISVVWIVVYSYLVWRHDVERMSPADMTPASHVGE